MVVFLNILDIAAGLVDKNVVDTVSTAVNVGQNVATEAHEVGTGISQLISTWPLLVGGLALIALAVVLWMFFKKIIVNSVLGLIMLIFIYFAFPEIFAHIWPIIVPAIIVTAIFGVGGIGTILFLIWIGVL